MTYRTISPLLLAYLLGTGQALAAGDWTLARQSDGISVYVMEVAGSDLLKVKTRVTIEASLGRIQQILDDVPRRKEWVPYLQHSAVIARLDQHSRIEHSVFAAPWPAADRDFTYRMQRLPGGEQQLEYSMTSEATELMPPQPGIIRAELMESRYTLSAVAPGQTRVELVFYADPKGWLPNWVINIIQQVLPYRMLKNLRALATAGEQNTQAAAGKMPGGQ